MRVLQNLPHLRRLVDLRRFQRGFEFLRVGVELLEGLQVGGRQRQRFECGGAILWRELFEEDAEKRQPAFFAPSRENRVRVLFEAREAGEIQFFRCEAGADEPKQAELK